MRRDSFLRQVVTAVARAQPAGAPVRIETADSQTARPASQLLTAIARATPAFTPGSAPALAPRRTASQQPERAAGVPRAVSKARKADDIVEFGLQVSPARRSRTYHQALIVALAGFAVPVILAAVILIEASAKIHHPQAPIAPASSAHPTPAKTAHCTAGTGFISFANLTPAVSPIDVYLYSSGDSAPQLVDRDVAYGTVLPYHSVGACAYSVEVRTAGSSSSSRPVLTGTVTAQAGRAYTVAALAVTSGARELTVIETDLTTPAGFSLVRVIQADPGQGQVTFHCSCAAGAPGNITTDAAPGTVSPQAPIPAGTWTMTATGRTAKASIPVTLTAGTVHTFVVIATPGGGIQIVNVAESVPRYRRVPLALPSAWRFVSVSALAFNPSGSTLAIASEKICLWDIAAARCTGALGNSSITAVTFSPDGKTLAASDITGRTYLWNVTTSTLAATLADSGSNGASSVAFSRDGKTLAVADSNGRTYLWNAATGKQIRSAADPGSKGVNSAAFSPDGKTLAAGDANGRTYLWNTLTGNPVGTLADSGSKGVTSVAFSRDGKILAAGDGNGRTYLWNAATGQLIGSLPDPSGSGVFSVAFSPDDTTIAAGDRNSATYIWNVVTSKLITTLGGAGNAAINSVAFNADGTTLATGDQDGNVSLWNTS